MALDPEARQKLRALVVRHKAEREQLIEGLQGAVDENEELKGKLGELEKVSAERDELKGKFKAGEFRKAFDAAAKKAGVKDDMLDDAWELSKVDTKADKPDEKAIGQGLKEFLEKRPHFKGESAGDDDGGQGDGQGGDKQGQAAADRLSKGAGHERGGAAKGPAGKFVVNRSDLSNMGWMQQNQAAYAAAVKADNVHYVGKEA